MTSFRFLDDTDAQRMLGIDRLTFEELLRTKRLRPISTSGENIHFFRNADVMKLQAELHPVAATSKDEVQIDDSAVAAALAEEEAALADPMTAAANRTTPKKGHDPAMRVHLRLQADLKWYDIGADDLQAWFNQLRPDGYERHLNNTQFIIERMQQIQALIHSGQQKLQQIAEPQANNSPSPTKPEKPRKPKASTPMPTT